MWIRPAIIKDVWIHNLLTFAITFLMHLYYFLPMLQRSKHCKSQQNMNPTCENQRHLDSYFVDFCNEFYDATLIFLTHNTTEQIREVDQIWMRPGSREKGPCAAWSRPGPPRATTGATWSRQEPPGAAICRQGIQFRTHICGLSNGGVQLQDALRSFSHAVRLHRRY